MGYSKEIYRRALEEKEAQRRAAERRAEENRQAAYAALPRLEEIDRQLAEKGARLALTALSGGDLADLEAACGRLTAEKEALLAGKGFSPADFQPAYACGDCKDTGKRAVSYTHLDVYKRQVLTRPSRHSGNPVTSDTPVTGTPAASRALAVPPVDSTSKPRATSSLANSTAPVLSDTLINARFFINPPSPSIF